MLGLNIQHSLMQKAGFSIRMYSKTSPAARRFAKPHRGMLYQGDIKYGPYLPIGKDDAKKVFPQVYSLCVSPLEALPL